MASLTASPAPPLARPVRRGPAPSLLVAAAVSAVCAVVVYLLLVRTGLGQRFDNAALAGSYQQLPQTRAEDAFALRRITADSFAVVLVLLAAIGVLRRRPRLGLGVAAAAGLAVVGTDLMKHYLLARPYLVRSDVLMPSNTYPSGHTATAIACALALVVVCPPRLRGLAAVLAGSYGWLTAAQVQTAGWHRPSDAIGAAFVAFAAVTVVSALLASWRPVRTVRGPRHLLAFLVLGAVWLGAGAVTALDLVRVLHFLLAHPDAATFTSGVQRDAYLISVNLTVVVVVTLLMALLALVARHDLDEPARRAPATSAGSHRARSPAPRPAAPPSPPTP